LAPGAPAPAPKLKVLIAAHSHPEVSIGGAEISAFQLFETLQHRADCQSWYLGCDRTLAARRPGSVLNQPWSDAEYLYAVESFDWFKFANPDTRLPGEIERLLQQLQPDVLHFHHYINFGVEILEYARRTLPNCRIVLTLHEYLAICHHYGQMVTKKHRTLCYHSSPDHCHACFPEFSPSDFFLRRRYIMRFFDLVDVFIAPSRFLADRYVAWGVPASKMVVLENLMPEPLVAPHRMAEPDEIIRIGFFGQTSALKGINVLFDAAERLAAENVSNVTFDIFGDYTSQPEEFQGEFLARLEKAGPNIQFNGPYGRPQLDGLIQSVHAVLVPSVWWENSPLVIQEALRNRRPVICSGIGGMAEKVRNGVDGWHFPAGNALALASLLRNLAKDPERLNRVAAAMTGIPASQSGIEDFLRIYRGDTVQSVAASLPRPTVDAGAGRAAKPAGGAGVAPRRMRARP